MGELVETGTARGIQGGRDLLRFITAGSVDDGKSTLIGRLLYDTKTIFEDQLEHVEDVSRRRGDERTNLALVTDGLRAEREQGITIDVAYRYFSTPRRKFIIADAPGHTQYTRNMVTGATTANLAIVLVDARKGLLEQSRRHAFIASLLGIPHIVFAVNKMDLVDYSEEQFELIKREFTEWAARLRVRDIDFIPISALHGDNVVDKSEKMPWYRGTPLLYHLETVHIASDRNLIDVRFPVQWVIRPQSDEHPDYRGYGGTVAGTVGPNERIRVRLLDQDGSTTVGVISHGPGVGWGAFTGSSMYAQETSSNTFDVYSSNTISCPGGGTMIVPDGPLWRTPFAALVREHDKRPVNPRRLYEQHAGCRFWIEEAALGLAPSAAFLASATP